MIRRPPMVGLGTGRCGTKSLAKILDGCNNAEVSHEKYVCPWYGEGKPRNVLMLADELNESAEKGVLAGEIGGYLLPHLGIIREAVPDLKIVWLERPKKEVVESFMRWCRGSRLRPSDKMRLGDMPHLAAPLPLIDAATPEQSWEFYWEMYQRSFEMLSPDVWFMTTQSLNNDGCLNDLFSYLEIPEEDRIIPIKRRHSSYEEVRGALN